MQIPRVLYPEGHPYSYLDKAEAVVQGSKAEGVKGKKLIEEIGDGEGGPVRPEIPKWTWT